MLAIPVIMAAYNPAWPQMAAGYAEQLRVLGPVLMTVHHIGSTAVPGLAAKPIIDLMPLVTDLADLDRQRGHMEASATNGSASWAYQDGAIVNLMLRPVLAWFNFTFSRQIRPTSSVTSPLETICARIPKWPALMKPKNAGR